MDIPSFFIHVIYKYENTNPGNDSSKKRFMEKATSIALQFQCMICMRKKLSDEIKICAESDDHYICIDCLKRTVAKLYHAEKEVTRINCSKKNYESTYEESLIREVYDIIDKNCYFEMYVQAIEITEQRITLLECPEWKYLVSRG